MRFYKNHKTKSTAELCLADYNNIWTKFCFLDETGSLNSGSDRFFTLAVIKMSQPYYLQSKILYERNKRNFHDELKFNSISKNKIEFAKFVIGAFFDTKSVSFYSYSISKNSNYFKKEFNNDPWVAYEKITLKLMDAVLSENEILILIADHVTTPKNIKFEKEVKKNFNSSKKRLAIAGVTRFDSKSNDLLQVVDLIAGIISYDLKIQYGLLPQKPSKYKTELLNYFKENLGATNFSKGFRNRIFNIFVDNTDEDLESKKGPSS